MQPTRLLVLFALIFCCPACSETRKDAKADAQPATRSPTTTSATATTSPTTARARAGASTQPHNFARWEKEIAAIEAGDKTNPPPKGGFLFVGSSMIRNWKTLAQDFPDRPVINRGFGGSEIVDSTYFADRLIFPHAPRMVLLRAGGNDIHAGKSAGQVFGEFKEFVAAIHAKLPKTEVVFISLSPAPARWAERDENKRLNALVAAYAKQTPRVKYVETYDMTLTPDGQAREELFVADKLHFNAEGYKLLTERVRAVLGK